MSRIILLTCRVETFDQTEKGGASPNLQKSCGGITVCKMYFLHSWGGRSTMITAPKFAHIPKKCLNDNHSAPTCIHVPCTVCCMRCISSQKEKSGGGLTLKSNQFCSYVHYIQGLVFFKPQSQNSDLNSEIPTTHKT